MSSEEKEKNQEKQPKQNNENDININESNNLILDLYDEDTLNISLEEEKPLFTKLYSNVYEKICSIKKENDNDNKNENGDGDGDGDNNELLTAFENLFKNQIDIINLCVKNNEQNFIYATNVLVAKFKIFNFFNKKYLEEYLNNSDLASSKLLSLINENMYNSFNKMVEIIIKLGQKSNKINNKITELQSRNNMDDIYIKQLEDENNLLNEKFNKLKEENELITKKLINNNNYFNNNYQINNNINNINKNNISNKKYTQNNTIKLKSKNNNPTLISNNIKENNAFNNNKNNINNSDKKQNVNINNNIKDPIKSSHSSNINNNVSLTNLSIAGNRVFTLKMMKEIISNIYTSKTAFDKKCLQNKQAKQTMEEFMYTYLEHFPLRIPKLVYLAKFYKMN